MSRQKGEGLVSGISVLALKIVFFSIRSCSSVSYAYYKPLSICPRTLMQGFPSQRSCQLLSMFQPVLCLSGSKISLEICNTTQWVTVFIRPAENGSKAVQSHCPDELRTTDFPCEIFQHKTENRSGWTQEANEGSVLLYLNCDWSALYRNVLYRWSDWMSPKNTRPVNVL